VAETSKLNKESKLDLVSFGQYFVAAGAEAERGRIAHAAHLLRVHPVEQPSFSQSRYPKSRLTPSTITLSHRLKLALDLEAGNAKRGSRLEVRPKPNGA